MTFLALIAIIFFGFAVYNLTCAFVDIPTKKTSQMMMLSRKQQGTKNEKLLDVYVTKIAGWIAPYLRLDRLKRNKVQRALDIAGLQLTPEVYTARAWVTAGAVGLCAIPMAFLIPLLVPILIGLAVALWFSTYYAAFDFVKKRRKLIEGEIPRFALTVGQSLENDRDVLKILTSYRRVAGKDFGAELDQTIADMKTGNYENALIRFETRIGSPMLSDVIRGLIGVLRGDDQRMYFKMITFDIPNGSCIFLTDGRCSVYPARTRTCRIYPLTVGPGERGRDFEYCLCLDRHKSHFTGSRVSVKDWLYQNFKREDKEYVKREYEIATELGKLMRAIDPAMRQGIVFKVLYYRYYNFDLDQPFQPQYEQNNRHLLADLHRIAREQ